MVTPPPAQKLSPIVIGAPYSETRIALIWIQWVQGASKLAVGTNHGILSNRNGTYIQHGQIVIGIEIFSQMDINPIIYKNLAIKIEVSPVEQTTL